MTDLPLGSLLASPPPSVTETALAALLAQHFGLSGRLRALTSERDLNFHLSTSQGEFVVKLANAAEPHQVTDFQTQALLHLGASKLPIPRVIRTQTGADHVATAQGRLRVLTYLQGVPQHLTSKTPAQSANLARMAAELSQALQGFSHPAASHVLQWDLKQAADLHPLLDSIPEADLRGLCVDVLRRFVRDIAPALPDVRWQVVHNDLNPHNVLTDLDDPDHISGVLDFGDMVETPLICDVAVTAAYQIDPKTAVQSLLHFACAYHAVLPLTPRERRLLLDLTATRMLTTVAIASARAQRYPENAPYILRNFPAARAGLVALANLDRAQIHQDLEAL